MLSVFADPSGRKLLVRSSGKAKKDMKLKFVIDGLNIYIRQFPEDIDFFSEVGLY